MPAKRVAGSQLTHDNWDEEDDVEEAGSFAVAEEDVLKNRVIKKAKRRGVTSDETPSVFKGFVGFGKPATPTTTSFAFNKDSSNTNSTMPSFSLANNMKPTASFGDNKLTNSTYSDANKATETVSGKDEGTAHYQATEKSKFLGALKALNESVLKWLTMHMEKNPYCYFTPVMDDYKKHVADLKTKYNYDDGLGQNGEMDSHTSKASPETQLHVNSNSSTGAAAFSFLPTQTSVIPKSEPSPSKGSQTRGPGSAVYTFGNNKSNKTTDSTTKSSIFGTATVEPSSTEKLPEPATAQPQQLSADEKSTSEISKPAPDAPKPLFSFNAGNSSGLVFGKTAAPSSGQGFSFNFGKTDSSGSSNASGIFGSGSSAPSSLFGNTTTLNSMAGFSFKPAVSNTSAKPAEANEAEAGNEDEDYVPPKPIVENKVTEDDALYSKRVKLFYEKDGKYMDKGVGNLYVKPLENGKRSLLIRADTNLGNVLLNILLNESIPIKRVGTNNVSLVCIANPPMDPKADKDKTTALLIRVKAEQDADELCNKLNQYKTPAS